MYYRGLTTLEPVIIMKIHESEENRKLRLDRLSRRLKQKVQKLPDCSTQVTVAVNTHLDETRKLRLDRLSRRLKEKASQEEARGENKCTST